MDKTDIMELSKPVFPCKACLKTFSKLTDLEKHIEWHSLQTKHMQSSFVKLEHVIIFGCEFCTRGFLHRNKLKQHQQKYFKGLITNSVDNNNHFEKPYKCQDCDLRFVKKSTLETHSIVHKPFAHTCECGIGYYKRCDLDSHRRLVHPLLKSVQTTVPKLKEEVIIKYKTDSEAEGSDIEDDNKPKRKVRPRLKAKLTYRKPKKEKQTSKKSYENLAVERDDNGKYKCPVCSKPYGSKKTLNIHMGEHNTQPEEMHKCNECPKEFSSGEKLYQHKRRHANFKSFPCSVCRKAFNSKVGLQTHMRVHTGEKPFACDLCPAKFSQTGTLKHHKLTHTGVKNFECTVCKKYFYTKDQLGRHMRIHTGEKPYDCKYCGKSFADYSAYKRHELTHTGLKPYQCKLCPKAFCDPSARFAHMRRHQGWTVPCPACYRTFTDNAGMRLHFKREHQIANEVEKFECDYCHKSFLFKQYLVIHIKNMHLYPEGFINCKYCEKKLCPRSLNNHIQHMHLKNYRFECPICGQRFAQKIPMKNHIMRMHGKTKERNYECDHCHKTYLMKIDLSRHIINVHMGIQCQLCKKPFSTTLKLKEHKLEGCRKCSVCGLTFHVKHHLRDHMNTHHLPKSERPRYECAHCWKQFPVRQTLVRHLKFHYAVNLKLTCDHCNETFSSKVAIRRHIWSRHMVSLYCNICLKMFYNDSEFKQHKRAGCQKRIIPCDFCDLTFSAANLLNSHLRVHGPRIRKCAHCRASYKDKSSLIRHLRSAHGF